MICSAHPHLKPGDIVGFSRRDWLGAMINLGSWGIPFVGITHVAIVGEHPASGRRVFYESTSIYREPCAVRNLLTSGVQAHWIEPRIETYPGIAWHYPLRAPLEETAALRLNNFCRRNLGAGYDRPGAVAARSTPSGWLARKIWNREDLTTFFCSEFCASALRACGRLKSSNASGWSPNSLCRKLIRDGLVETDQIRKLNCYWS